MRDAASSLAKPLQSPRSAPGHPSGMSRSESIIGKLDAATSKIASITADLANFQQRESEIRTKLLRHMAGVLSIVLRRREEEEAYLLQGPTSAILDAVTDGGAASRSPVGPSRQLNSSASAYPDSHRSSPSPIGGRKNNGKEVLRFEGPHLFANNKDATTPLPRTALTSPQLLSFSTFSSPHNSRQVDPAVHAELERNLAEVEASLSHAGREIEELRSELAQAHSTAEDADQRRRQAEETASQAESRAERAQAAVSAETESRRGLSESQRESAKLKNQIAELEARLRREKSERNRWQEEAGHSRQDLLDHHQQLRESVEAVLQKHKRASGSLTRLLPSTFFGNEEEDNAFDAASTLSASLDAHFYKSAEHITGLQRDLSTLQSQQNDKMSQTGQLGAQLEQAKTELQSWREKHDAISGQRDTLQRDLEQHRRSRSQADLQTKTLESRLAEANTHLGSIDQLERDLEAARAELDRCRTERDTASSSANSLQARLDDLSSKDAKQTKALADIWRALPAADARAKLTDAEDLKSFKAVFASSSRIPLGNFGLDLVNAPKFTIEEFAEKVSFAYPRECVLLTVRKGPKSAFG